MNEGREVHIPHFSIVSMVIISFELFPLPPQQNQESVWFEKEKKEKEEK